LEFHIGITIAELVCKTGFIMGGFLIIKFTIIALLTITLLIIGIEIVIETVIEIVEEV
jgi:hypothetical protein